MKQLPKRFFMISFRQYDDRGDDRHHNTIAAVLRVYEEDDGYMTVLIVRPWEKDIETGTIEVQRSDVIYLRILSGRLHREIEYLFDLMKVDSALALRLAIENNVLEKLVHYTLKRHHKEWLLHPSTIPFEQGHQYLTDEHMSKIYHVLGLTSS